MLVDDTSRLVDYLNWMQAHSWSIIDSVDKDWTYNFYRDKTLARIKKYNAIDVERWIIGLDWDAICNKAQLTSYWHGDCSFENIVCPSAGLSVLGGALFTNIDWREDAYGDVYYDLAKLLKSIHFDHRTLTEGGEFKGHRHVTLLEDSLAGWCDANGYDWTHVRRIYALAVLAMSGSHDGAFGQALFDWGKAELEVFV
jgi:aminoglycoside phosphotransferase (APT) family kinase protein